MVYERRECVCVMPVLLYVCVCVCIYIYIYISYLRERERERERDHVENNNKCRIVLKTTKWDPSPSLSFSRFLVCGGGGTGLDWTGLDWTGLDWTVDHVGNKQQIEI